MPMAMMASSLRVVRHTVMNEMLMLPLASAMPTLPTMPGWSRCRHSSTEPETDSSTSKPPILVR
jgi:hypothetical protein